jgi:acyl carrier protein
MQFSHWRATIDSKVKVSWNLHLELPRNLNFFVLISSMMGIIGSSSLAAYNAGNTYQDTLARYRILQGERAVSINLGAVPDAGYLVENEKYRYIPSMKRTKKYALTHVKELCALLDIVCGPGNSSSQSCQAIVGIRPPAHWKHLEEVPATMSQPFWGHMHHIPGPGSDELQLPGNQARQKYSLSEIGDKIAAAGSLKEAAGIVSEALADRLVAILGTAHDRLDSEKPLHSYGMDSLSAIDLRNWVGKAFDVDLPVSEIFGGLTLADAALAIIQKMAGSNN